MRFAGQDRMVSLIAPNATALGALAIDGSLIVGGTTVMNGNATVASGNLSITAGYLEIPTDAANPRIRGSGDTDSGFGLTAANKVAVFAGGSIVETLEIAKIVVAATQLLLPDGTTAVPGLAYASETGMGMFRNGAGNNRLVASNTFQLVLASGASQFNGNLIADSVQPTKFKLPFSTSQNVTGAASSLASNSTSIQFSSDGVYTLTSTPTLSAGTNDGQLCVVLNTSANAVTFQDESSLAGSKLKLGAATRTLGQRDMLFLTYNLADTKWYELSFANLV